MFGEFISHPTCLPTPNFHEKLKAYDLHTGDKKSSHTVRNMASYYILDDSENGLESSAWNSALRNTVIQCFFCFCPSLVCWNTSFRSPKLEELAPPSEAVPENLCHHRPTIVHGFLRIPYCWWFKTSCTSWWYGFFVAFLRFCNYILGGAGVLASTIHHLL